MATKTRRTANAVTICASVVSDIYCRITSYTFSKLGKKKPPVDFASKSVVAIESRWLSLNTKKCKFSM